ncbi:MAG: class I poly(R)-hydroxyalkanoic acid synthase [Alphaproteobacteria bacterium]|nr:class I poly(R)-hydroxyalkanoic acid synthase [Alphaproteobacteria bacterium]MDD9919650.1 class I poly(R)-hydroxyalkanoic acid synthase [Alphaproteobacteria bacterium]
MTQTTPQIDFTHLGKQTTHLLEQFVQQQGETVQSLTPIMEGFQQLTHNMLQNPQQLMQMQFDLYQATLNLWAHMAERAMAGENNENIEPLYAPQKGDGRFKSDEWQENLVFDFIKQSYLLTSQWLLDAVQKTDNLDEETRTKVSFYTRQYLDALSPTNFPLTNPEVLKATVESNGENLINGLQNLLTDIQRGKISMTDYEAFEIGKNIATTEGEVVFRNHMFELIQYTPKTKKVYEKPLLITPPWINKYYILDLQPKNSLIKYAVEECGVQTFLISWKNPDETYKDISFEDYMQDALLEAVTQVLEITGQKDLNAVGYCIGGTLLAATLAVMKKKKDTRINSATFFTTLTDFSEAGELKIFTDEAQISHLEEKMNQRGYLDGKEMAATFSMLRANDLIWGFVVNNYLLGKQPFPFDLLYWNDDPTRMPAAMHSWYLRNLYLENNLVKKNHLTLMGETVDISLIDVPLYMVGAISDHITPWQSTYGPLVDMASKDKTYVLSKAGHIAGVVNPPTPEGKPIKRAYWTGNIDNKNPDVWLKQQEQQSDSWWPHWNAWLSTKSGKKIDSPKKLGSSKNKPLCAAPGTYVKE